MKKILAGLFLVTVLSSCRATRDVADTSDSSDRWGQMAACCQRGRDLAANRLPERPFDAPVIGKDVR